jgi:ABC-2 type transport system ATP-binding protein
VRNITVIAIERPSLVIEAEELVGRYDGVVAVDRVSFAARQGEIFGFLGPNGAGKTTTQRMLTGVLPPTSGTARVCGYDIQRDPIAAKSCMGVVPEVANPYADLSGWQNLMLAGEMYAMARAARHARAESLLREFGLWERRHQKAKGYSKGMKQRLLLTMALIHEPPVLFLDEPTSGLDVESARLIREQLRALSAQGVTVFLTTHNIEEANQLCDRVAIICRGRLAAVDRPEALKAPFASSQSVVVSFDRAMEVSELDGLPGVSQVEKEGDKWRLFTAAPGAVIRAVVEYSATQGVEIVTLNTLGPSLEDVFLALVQGESKGQEVGR